MFIALATFAARRPTTYLATCAALGLLVRWFWCGQDLTRFLNPLAPVFA